ncbi:MAG: hypothetical protein ABDH37_08675 [Candidatus Hydrothermales bacterium]
MFNFKLFEFLILNSILYFSIFKFLYFFKEKIGFIDRLILSFLIYLTFVLGMYGLFGFFNLYEWKVITISIIVLSLFFSTFKFKVKESYLSFYNEFKNSLKNLFFSLKNDPFLLIIFLLIFLEFFLLLRFIFMYPPEGWDSYIYHLPIVSRIVIEKGFPSENFMNLNIMHMYFPKNVEVLFAYYYIFTGTDRGMLIVHFPFLIFGALSSYSILRKLSIPKEKSLYIFSILLIPIIPNLAGCAYVDIETSFIFLIFLNLLLLKFPFNIIFPLISLSIGAGTKLSFLPIFGLFLLYGMVKLFIKREYNLLLLTLFLSFITSFHYYIYNFYLTGNPFYPYIIKIFGLEIFKGKKDVVEYYYGLPVFTYNPFIIFKCLAELWHFDSNNYYTYDNRDGGFGHFFISLGIVPFLISIFLSIKNKEKNFLKVIFGTFLFFLTSSYRWWPRFHIYLPFVAFIGTIYLWDKWNQKNLKCLIILLALFSFIEGMHNRVILSPYSDLNSYKENIFELSYIPPKLTRSYSNLGFYLEKNDKIGVWNLRGVSKALIGLILRNNFLIYLEEVENEKKLKYYDKILTSPGILVEGYNKIYEDENLCLWIK